MDTSIVRKGDFFVKRFISTRIAGGFLLRNGSLALQANHAQQAKAKSFKQKNRANTVTVFALFFGLRERRAISRVMSWMIIYLAVPSPAQSSNLPGQCCLERQPTGRQSVLFGLASDGVYMCPGCYHPGGGLLHRLCTLTGLGRRFFSVALSWEFPPPDVIRHPAL